MNLFYSIIVVHYLIGLALPPRIHLLLINVDAADLGGAKKCSVVTCIYFNV